MAAARDITQKLQRIQLGDRDAEAAAFAMLYRQLRTLAQRRLRRERAGHTLQPTALVHEAYLRLAGQRDKVWQDRTHFLAVASQIMRRILVDYARQRDAAKRGGDLQRVADESLIVSESGNDIRILDLDRALDRLSEMDPRQARMVEYRFFGGMSEEELSSIFGVTVRTIRRDWSMARAWLRGELQPPKESGHCMS